jgi:hypothetical protein
MFSNAPIPDFFIGAFFLFIAAKGYRLRKRYPNFVESIILPFIGGVALLIVGTLNLLGILTEAWSSVILNVLFCFLIPSAMILAGRRQTAPRAKIALIGSAVIIAILGAGLCYSSIMRAYGD